MLAPVAGEMAVVAVDHPQAGAPKREKSKVEMPARSGKVANAAWAKARCATGRRAVCVESNIYVRPDEAAERRVMRCRGT